MFVLMVVCVVFDRDASKVLEVLSWLALISAAITDRQGAWRRRIVPVAISLTVVLVSSAAAAWLAGEWGGAVYSFVKYQIAVLWLAILWLIVPVFLYPTWRELNPLDDNRHAGRLAYVLVVLLVAFAFYGTISAAASMFPKESMKLLGAELLPYAGLFVIITRMASCTSMPWLRIGLRGAWLVVVMTCIGMAVIALGALWSTQLSNSLLEQEFLRVDSDAPDARRLQFLFHHHNRAGYFAACGLFLTLAGAFERRLWRWLGIVGAVAAAIALPFTLTRGALVAASAGMVLFSFVGILIHRRARWPTLAAIVIGLPLMWVWLPVSYKEHIRKIADVQNYQQGEGGSIGARFIMWETALKMIKERPGLGFGYGFENFVTVVRADHPDKPDYFKGAPHAHNMWLETAAENGVAAAVLLLVFTVVRIGGLVRAWWRSMRRRHGLVWLLLLWLCLEVVVQVYGLTNYALRRNLGFLTYWIWAGSVVLVLVSARADTYGQRNKPMELPRY